MATISRSNLLIILLALVWASALVFLGYVPKQDEFVQIIIPYAIAFGAYLFVVNNVRSYDWRFLVFIAVLTRLLLVFAFPNLSDDIYRFVWDGRLIHMGVNPFSVIPADIAGRSTLLDEGLFNRLNSPNYFSVYPPVSQLVFYLSTIFSSHDLMVEVITMKLILLLFEIGALWGIISLLRVYGLPEHRLLLYVLNPLVVIEIMGNMHFEGVVVCLFIWSVYWLERSGLMKSAVLFALSVLTKLLPMMFAPMIFFHIKGNRRIQYAMMAAVLVIFGFLPFVIGSLGQVTNLGESLDLYLRKFEFNAGLYYVLRWVGYLIYGYNLIHVLGPVLLVTFVLYVGCVTWRYMRNPDEEDLLKYCLFIFTGFLFLSMTVHPWYLIIPMSLCIFTRFRFPILWTGLIFMTYINYAGGGYSEKLWVVGLEYVAVFLYLWWELRKKILDHELFDKNIR